MLTVRPNPFASGRIDRASHRRQDEEWLAKAKESASSRVALVWRSKSLVFKGDEPRLGLLPLQHAPDDGPPLAENDTLVMLGVEDERTVFAADVSQMDDPIAELELPQDAEFEDLRRLAGLLEPSDGSLAAYARAMMSWLERHRYCGLCGSPTEIANGGHLRRCSSADCDCEIFPRTDPAVIMLVVDGERCLLGRQARWASGTYSTLAGFVEPGESLEDAVRREVLEETGIEVDDCRYSSSQPWPFPSSLMLGFYATRIGGDIVVDNDEIEEAQWFTRNDLLERRVKLPGRLSIARRLIEDWLRGDVGS